MMTTIVLAAAEGSTTVVKALDHDSLFLLLVQLAVLLFAARFLGEIMRKLGQPPVVGELLAGVALGPSIFGAVAPDLQSSVFPMDQHQSDLLAAVSWLGVLFLLVATGLETDLALIKRRGKSALMVSAGGIIVPFATGFTLGWMLPPEFIAQPEGRLVFALFMAVAMSISAVPVIAKVLMDLRLTRRDIGQLIMASAMTDDTIGWILLSVVAGLARTGTVNVLSITEALGGALLFLALAFTIGSRVVGSVISVTDKLFGGTNAQLSVLLVLALGTAALTHQMHIEAVLGAFVIGILVVQAPRFRHEAGHILESITASFLAPIFFASAGVKVDLVRLADPDVFAVGLVVLGIACIGKFVGAYIGAWAAGISHWERLAMGSGMNARGAMEIVVATVGLGLGVLTVEMYSIIVMVAIVTSVMAPPLLRWTLSKVTMGADEARRLEREQIAASSFVRGVRRVLVVGRTPAVMRIPLQLVAYLSHEQPIEATAVQARAPAVRPRWWWPWGRRVRRYAEHTRAGAEQMRRTLDLARGARDVKIVTDRDRSQLVLVEAARGYGLAVLADVQRAGTRTLFSTTVDEVLRHAPCPTMLVQVPRQEIVRGLQAWTPKKILVPTVGTEVSKYAVEVAAVLAASAEATVLVVHVVRRRRDDEAETALSHEIVDNQAAWGRKFGAKIETLLLDGEGDPELLILQAAREREVDLIIVGSSLRVVRARAFYGDRIEHILRHAPCPVAIVSAG